jgi:hypothetical protein
VIVAALVTISGMWAAASWIGQFKN